ncbi:MAG: hypothetical protein CMF62_03960 [Magnetococcales bacterium]|nr:hypothetical protein [Magnetococcales bacterium]
MNLHITHEEDSNHILSAFAFLPYDHTDELYFEFNNKEYEITDIKKASTIDTLLSLQKFFSELVLNLLKHSPNANIPKNIKSNFTKRIMEFRKLFVKIKKDIYKEDLLSKRQFYLKEWYRINKLTINTTRSMYQYNEVNINDYSKIIVRATNLRFIKSYDSTGDCIDIDNDLYKKYPIETQCRCFLTDSDIVNILANDDCLAHCGFMDSGGKIELYNFYISYETFTLESKLTDNKNLKGPNGENINIVFPAYIFEEHSSASHLFTTKKECYYIIPSIIQKYIINQDSYQSTNIIKNQLEDILKTSILIYQEEKKDLEKETIGNYLSDPEFRSKDSFNISEFIINLILKKELSQIETPSVETLKLLFQIVVQEENIKSDYYKDKNLLEIFNITQNDIENVFSKAIINFSKLIKNKNLQYKHELINRLQYDMLETDDYEYIDYNSTIQEFRDVEPTTDIDQLVFDINNLPIVTIKFMKEAMDNFNKKIKPLSYLIRYLNEDAMTKKEEFSNMKIGLNNRHRILAFAIQGIVKNTMQENIFNTDSATEFINKIYHSSIIEERLRQKEDILNKCGTELDFRISIFIEKERFMEYVSAIHGITQDQAILFLDAMIENDTKEVRKKFEILINGEVQSVVLYPKLYPSSNTLEKFFYKYKDSIPITDFYKMYYGLDHKLYIWNSDSNYQSPDSPYSFDYDKRLTF